MKTQGILGFGARMSAEVLTFSVSPCSFSSVKVLYIYQLNLGLQIQPFKFSVPHNSVRMYSSSSLKEKTEEWEVTGRVRYTLSQLAVDMPFCDLFTG